MRNTFCCRSKALVMAIFGSAALSACGASTELDWSEEVKLHDGRVIVVTRHEELGSSGFPVKKRGFIQYHHFCYPPMGIQWKSYPGYFPQTFDIVDGRAYVMVPVTDGETCEFHGYPETNAIYFRWESGTWKKIDYKDFPKGLRYNMLNGTHSDNRSRPDAHGLITIAQKHDLDAGVYREMAFRGNSGLHDSVDAKNACAEHKTVRRNCCSKSTTEIFMPTNNMTCK